MIKGPADSAPGESLLLGSLGGHLLTGTSDGEEDPPASLSWEPALGLSFHVNLRDSSSPVQAVDFTEPEPPTESAAVGREEVGTEGTGAPGAQMSTAEE